MLGLARANVAGDCLLDRGNHHPRRLVRTGLVGRRELNAPLVHRGLAAEW